MDDYSKQRVALRYWLIGAGYHKAAEAMEWVAQFHQGKRKDGSPEFSHQLAIASHVRTLVTVLARPEETIIIALLHDTVEDVAAVTVEMIRERYGDFVADGVDALSKVVANTGEKRVEEIVFANIAGHEGASVVKAADRAHNLKTMPGAFTRVKQEQYVKETRTWFFNMLKTAKRRFPHQEPAYENLKLTLTVQCLAFEAGF